MNKDYNYQIVVKYDGKYPLDEYGHHLDPNSVKLVERQGISRYSLISKSPRQVALNNVCNRNLLGLRRKFEWAQELTNPYGSLHFAIGATDDFHCFDYAILSDGRIILNATVNSETGSFIQNAGYEVVSLEEGASIAMNMTNDAMDWLEILSHDNKGWGQDPYYFYRQVFWDCDQDKNKPGFSSREFRTGGKTINKYCKLSS